MQSTAFAGIAGRLTGTTYRHLATTASLIDWAEVWATFTHGLRVVIVMLLMTGRATRRAWDALPGLSERLGKAYAQLITGQATEHVAEQVEPQVDYASMLEALTVRDLRATCVTLGLPSKAYRAARKADLVALLAELHVNPTI